MSAYRHDSIAAPVFVLEPDAAGRPVYAAWNRQASTFFGRAKDDVLGHTILELHHGRQARHMYDEQMRCLQTGEPVRYSILIDLHGSTHLVESTLHPELDETGRVTRVIGIAIDRTEEAALREELTLSRMVQDEMAAFMGMAAQDLSTPMAIVRDLTDKLRDGFQDLGDGKLQAIDALEQLATGSLQLISDMMQNVPLTPAVVERSIVSLRRLVDDALVLADPDDRHHVDCADLRLDVDETVLQIVLRDIFAARFDAARGAPLFVQVDVRDLGEEWMRIEVTDAGPGEGLPADEPPAKDDARFASARRLIEARGGLLQIDHRTDGAASVSFSLPAQIVGGKRASVLRA